MVIDFWDNKGRIENLKKYIAEVTKHYSTVIVNSLEDKVDSTEKGINITVSDAETDLKELITNSFNELNKRLYAVEANIDTFYILENINSKEINNISNEIKKLNCTVNRIDKKLDCICNCETNTKTTDSFLYQDGGIKWYAKYKTKNVNCGCSNKQPQKEKEITNSIYSY